MKATVWAVSMQKLIIDRWMREWYHKKPAKVWWKQKHGTDSYCVDVVLTAVTAARFTRRVERLTEAVSGRNPHHWSPVSWWGPEKCEKWGEKWVRKNRWWSGFAEVFKGGGGGEGRRGAREQHGKTWKRKLRGEKGRDGARREGGGGEREGWGQKKKKKMSLKGSTAGNWPSLKPQLPPLRGESKHSSQKYQHTCRRPSAECRALSLLFPER